MASKKWVYTFAEGRADMKNLLGGKGANLAEMTNIGLPVPPGIIVTTEACIQFYSENRQFPPGMEDQVREKMRTLEQKTGKQFGNPDNPLLVSVRSGAVISMPGMMDTVLNLGLNDDTVRGLAQDSGDGRFAMDCYRRFLNMFGDVVLGIDHDKFERILSIHKDKVEVRYDNQLNAEQWQAVVEDYKKLILRETGEPFPQDPMEQLFKALYAVFNSWNSDRAIVYRKVNKIPDDLGTAVNIQAMVFGNLGNDCGTGVAFTRDPSTGTRELYGEYLINAQGEDVVAGIRTPQPIATLKNEMPAVYEEFDRICALLEKHYRNMQDIEFTIERGKLFMLQTRNGKRTAQAAMKIAVDMVNEGLINKEEVEAIDKAIESYNKASEIDPTIYYVWYDLGYIYYLQGADFFDRSNDETHEATRNKLIELGKEKYQAAIPILEKAYELNTENRDVKFETLDLLQRIYYKEEMTAEYDRVKELKDNM